MSRALYTARAQRDGNWWAISVAGLPGALTQVRRLDRPRRSPEVPSPSRSTRPKTASTRRWSRHLTDPQRAAINELDQAKASYAAAAAALTERQQDVARSPRSRRGPHRVACGRVAWSPYQRVCQLTTTSGSRLQSGEEIGQRQGPGHSEGWRPHFRHQEKHGAPRKAPVARWHVRAEELRPSRRPSSASPRHP